MKRTLILSFAIVQQFLFCQFTFAAKRPNVVLIVADDLGYADLGCYGSDDLKTPSIDRLATDGVRLTQFYANAPECTPTRTALLTGRYQHRVGGLECAIGVGNVGRYTEAKWLSDRHELGLPADIPTVPSLLKKAGYVTACIGKWHLGYDKPFHPMNHGFDSYFGPLGGGCDYFHHTEPSGKFLGNVIPGERFFQDDRTEVDVSGTYLTDLLSDHAANWISKRTEESPFFLYLPYTAPHTPYQGPDDFRDEKMTADEWNKGTRETYREMVETLDSGIGRVLEALEQTGRSKNTLVVFISDNGPTKIGDAGVLRGNKGNVYEGGIRVPCVIRWPEGIDAGMESDRVGITMDLGRSIVTLAGTDSPAGWDGIDLIGDIMADRPETERTLFWRIRRGERTRIAVRIGDWKYVELHDEDSVERGLFNLASDVSEKNDLLEMRPAIVGDCKAALGKWSSEVKPVRGP